MGITAQDKAFVVSFAINVAITLICFFTFSIIRKHFKRKKKKQTYS